MSPPHLPYKSWRLQPPPAPQRTANKLTSDSCWAVAQGALRCGGVLVGQRGRAGVRGHLNGCRSMSRAGAPSVWAAHFGGERSDPGFPQTVAVEGVTLVSLISRPAE